MARVENAGDSVGVDPSTAGDLARQWESAQSSLDAQSIRVQRLLDEAGVSSTVPQQIRAVGHTCGAEAVDLRRRIRLVRSPLGPRRAGAVVFSRATDTGVASAPCGVVQGPAWPAPVVTGPPPGPVVLTTIGVAAPVSGQRCTPAGSLGGGVTLVNPATTRPYTEGELEGGSETLTEAEKEAVRQRQAGGSFDRGLYAHAVKKRSQRRSQAGET